MDDLILALETSSEQGSIALGLGRALRAERTLPADRRHAGQLLPTIRSLLSEVGAAPTEVAVVAFSRGPGSFTGLRTAATIARLWQAATGVPVVAAPTLMVIARNLLALTRPGESIAVLRSSRVGELFGALYARTEGGIELVAEAARHEAATWIAGLPEGVWAAGDGAAALAEPLALRGARFAPAETWTPRAAEVLALAAERHAARSYATVADMVPLYLRPPECEEVYDARRAAARARRAGTRDG